MPICINCGHEVLANYQTIETKRKTKVYICDTCVKKSQRKEVNSAKHSK